MIAERKKPASLTGTLKQVQYAERIRRDVLKIVPAALADELSQVRSAHFWLSYKDRTPEEWLGISASDGPSLFAVQCPRYTHEDGADWARRLDLGRCVMVDVETTGLGQDDGITEIAIVRMSDRAILLNTPVRPTAEPNISQMEDADLLPWDRPDVDTEQAPLFASIALQVARYLTTCTPVAYNATFDLPMIRQAMRRCGQPVPVPRLVSDCAMRAYTAYSERDRYASLEAACLEMDIDRTRYGQTHRALADALATIDLVEAMREGR